jgi:hypothetical protein
MTSRQINVYLRTLSIAIGVGAVIAVLLGLFLPLATDGQSSAGAKPTAPVAPVPTSNALPELASFSSIFAHRLRAPLGEQVPAAPAAAEVPAAPAPAELTLVGTVGSSLAMIKGPDGTVALIEVGDDVDGAEVLSIAPSQVQLRLNGRVTTLFKAPENPGDSAISP